MFRVTLSQVAPRARQEDRVPELLRIASDVFGARGYAGASLQEIADLMGILKGSLYHYAQTKEGLLYMILKEGHSRATATIEAHQRSSSTLSNEPGLISFVRLWMERGRYLDFGGLGAESHDYTTFLTAPHRAEIRGVRRGVSNYFAEVISADRRSGFIRQDIDPGTAARSLLVIMNATHEWVRDYSDQWDEVLGWYVRLFSTGVSAASVAEPDRPTHTGAGLGRNGTRPLLQEKPAEHREEGRMRGERWEELVGIAAEVFGERTYPGASLSEIARRMGIRKASLFHYIENKEDLLFELQRRAHERGVRLIESASGDSSGSAAERLRRFILRWAEGLETLDYTYVPLGVTDLQFMTSEHAAVIRSMRRRIRDFVNVLMADGVCDGSFDSALNVRYATTTLLLSLNRSIRWYQAREGGPSMGEWHLRLFLEGLSSQEWRSAYR